MNWIETLIIALGISLDILAAVEYQGARVATIRPRQLVLISLLLSAWQVVSLYLGNLCAELLCRQEQQGSPILTGRIVAVVVFFCLGIRLLMKAWRKERLDECRQEHPDYKRLLRLGSVTAFYTFLTGAAFGFLGTSVQLILLMVLGITILCVIVGMYIGYHFGFEPRAKVYAAGGILLLIGGVDVVIRYIL